jgi:hypothetical protein
MAGGLIAYYAFDLHFGIEGRYLLVAWSAGLLALLVFADRVSDGELSKRLVRVRARLTRLVEERSRWIGDANTFYTSPEWKLLREAIIEEQGHSCGDCGAAIDSRMKVTVGHRLPRNKYPSLALSRDNLNVLCRSCSLRRRDREPE